MRRRRRRRRRRRLTRLLLSAATAVSLVLFAATVVLWFRSRSALESWGFDHYRFAASRREQYAVINFSDAVAMDWKTMHWAEAPDTQGWSWRHYTHGPGRSLIASPPGGFTTRRLAGFGFDLYRPTGVHRQFCLLTPHWALAGLFAAWPIARALRRARRPACPGLCPACGYDLRATPERCRECGAVPPAAR